MPTYEFRCPDGTIIERVFKMSDVPQSIPAPDGSGMAVRIISGGADLIFKGSGFYITDYGKDGKKDVRARNEERASKSESGAEGKPDSAKSGESANSSKTEQASAESSSKTEKGEKKSDPKPDAKPDTKSDAKPDKPSPPSGAAA